nr:MAG TPA: hypothetical protein [Caudoviricetes sp.]
MSYKPLFYKVYTRFSLYLLLLKISRIFNKFLTKHALNPSISVAFVTNV